MTPKVKLEILCGLSGMISVILFICVILAIWYCSKIAALIWFLIYFTYEYLHNTLVRSTIRLLFEKSKW